MTNIFDDFPTSKEWWLGEKAIKWKNKHEKEIIESLNKLEEIMKWYEKHNLILMQDCVYVAYVELKEILEGES